MKREQLVIIGGVAAGMKAATRARRVNPNLKITVFEEKDYVSYAACGLPYYTSGVVKEREELVLRTPEDFIIPFDIQVHTNHRVTKIDPQNNQITVFDLKGRKEIVQYYDKLIIATGAKPIVPPLPGVNLSRIYTIKTVEDASSIKDYIGRKQTKKAIIIGAGLIGLEMAESLVSQGLEVTIVEMMNQVLPPLDEDMAYLIEKHLIEKGVNVSKENPVEAFEGNIKAGVKQVITKNARFDADLVILSIGIRPNTQLAQEAGVALGETRAIKVNERMLTNIPEIYAAGDCSETFSLITGKPTWVPLGSTANKQGRVAGENAAGGDAFFRGVSGTMIAKVFDYTVAKTGLSEREAMKHGYEIERAIIYPNSHAHYYTDAKGMFFKIIAEKKSNRVLGAQIIGEDGVDKRIDVIASAIAQKATFGDLQGLDMAYAPPYSPAVDPVIVAGYVLSNKSLGLLKGMPADELKRKLDSGEKFTLLDVRDDEEYKKGHLPGAKHIPFNELRGRIGELDPDQEVIIYCLQGLRSYNAIRTLQGKGFTKVMNLDGGINMWRWKLE
ncbi:MAG: FAD-dependent oxidoreductase [Desulfobacterales bacterium]|nr:FAD-dependent oxidoreductase [Desulfobacterales bacterium]